MNILVFCDYHEEVFGKPVLEIMSYGRALANQTQGVVIAMVVGDVPDASLDKLSQYGADKVRCFQAGEYVLVNRSELARAIEQEVTDNHVDMVLFTSGFQGKALAPLVAAAFGGGLVAGVTGMPVSLDPFVVPRMVFSGKVLVQQQINTKVKVLRLQQNSFGLQKHPMEKDHQKLTFDWNIKGSAIQRVELNKQKGKVLLTEADIVVSAGRGMRGPQNWHPVEELARLLDGATACSRPVADEGWRPHDEHVGQTGKMISPNLYIALGISGAIQHVAGVSASKVIVAVNKDKDAPLFDIADYGIVGDLDDVLPRLIEAVKSFKIVHV